MICLIINYFFIIYFKNNDFFFEILQHFYLCSIDDDYVPKAGDIVSFKTMLMPPKNEKMMAVHIKLLHLAEGVKHESWEEAVEHDIEHRRPSRSDDTSHTHEVKDNGSHVQN